MFGGEGGEIFFLTFMLKSDRVASEQKGGLRMKRRGYGYGYCRYCDSGDLSCP